MGKDASEQTLFYGDATEQVEGIVQDKDFQRESEPRDEQDVEDVGKALIDLGRARNWGRGGKARTGSMRRSSRQMDEFLHDTDDDAFKDQVHLEETVDVAREQSEVDSGVPAVPFMQEAALHQRAKALGLPDTLEASTPTAQSTAVVQEGSLPEGDTKQLEDPNPESILPIMQEAAAHQRAKVLGLPDEPEMHVTRADAAQEPPALERQAEIALPVSFPEAKEMFEEQKAFDKEASALELDKSQNFSALAPMEDFSAAPDSDVVRVHLHEERAPLSERLGDKIEETVHVISEKAHVINEKIGETAQVIKGKLLERRNSLEEAGHNARVKIDAALEKKFGYQAEKIQTEFEKARLSAISDTAHIAELLQAQLRHGAADLREQQQARMMTADPLLADQKEEAPLHDPSGALPSVGENAVAQRFLDLEHNIEATGCIAREKIDTALEKKFGPRVGEILLESEKAKDIAIDETARAVETLEVQLGKCVCSFRDQLVNGPTPTYH